MKYGSNAKKIVKKVTTKKKTTGKKKPAPKKTNKYYQMKAKKSTVNKAGNYTKPTMRKKLFNQIKAGSKGGNPGQWSARKAQMLAKKYKAAGGGYKSKK